MHILMIDDEEDTLSDHRAALRHAGHRLFATTRLEVAVSELEHSFQGHPAHPPFDFVLIDLLLPGQIPPDALSIYYNGLTKCSHNEGQSLGQWLWECAGAHQFVERPLHCYFSNVIQLYCLHRDVNHQEFSASAQTQMELSQARKFVLDKTRIRPSKLDAELGRVATLWNTLKKAAPPSLPAGSP
jgi:response regulator RpfG family c-di-GMP phosphodiesterase